MRGLVRIEGMPKAEATKLHDEIIAADKALQGAVERGIEILSHHPRCPYITGDGEAACPCRVDGEWVDEADWA